MFDELEKYKNKNHFFFSSGDDLEKVCNAPKDGKGVYLVYELKNGGIDLVYIGSTGKVRRNGQINTRNGGLYDSIVNGHQFGKNPRKISWKKKLTDEGIDALDVYWYVTFDDDFNDIPDFVESIILQRWFDITGSVPRWNEEL